MSEWRRSSLARNYYISADGRVRNPWGQLIRVHTLKSGARRVRILVSGGRHETVDVDDLVQEVFPEVGRPAPSDPGSDQR